MKKIESKHNEHYRAWKFLSKAHYHQKQQGLAWLEGLHLAQEFLSTQQMPRFCLIDEAKQHVTEVQAIVVRVPESRVYVLKTNLFESLAQTMQGVGVIFLIDRPQMPAEVIADDTILILDGLQDPGNVGSILRTAVAAGVRSVLALPKTVNFWSDKVLRAAMGAHFKLNLVEDCSLDWIREQVKQPMIVLDSHASASLYQANLNCALAWVLGHEGVGVCAPLRELSTQTLAIPHATQMESLNVAAAAAICLFEQYRQRASTMG